MYGFLKKQAFSLKVLLTRLSANKVPGHIYVYDSHTVMTVSLGIRWGGGGGNKLQGNTLCYDLFLALHITNDLFLALQL